MLSLTSPSLNFGFSAPGRWVLAVSSVLFRSISHQLLTISHLSPSRRSGSIFKHQPFS